jgi:hypothetical protein
MPPLKNAVNRDAKGQFLKGSVPNPKGRPKKGESLTEILREYGNKKVAILDGVELRGGNLALKEHLAEVVYLAVILGCRIVKDEKVIISDVAWAKLLEWLYDRVDGKPTEKLQIASLPEVEVTSEDMAEAVKELELWKEHRASKNIKYA